MSEGVQSVDYRLEVETGDVRGAGTDANVFITLVGSHASTPKTQLVVCFSTVQSDPVPLQALTSPPLYLQDCCFDRGKVGVATLACSCDLGALTRVIVEHDNTGFGPDWFLDQVHCSCLISIPFQ